MLPRPGVRPPPGRLIRVVAALGMAFALAPWLQATGVPPPGEGGGAAAKRLRLDDVRRIPRHRLPTIRSYRWAAAAALSVVERDLHMPTLHGEIALYSSDEAFLAACLKEGRRDYAADSSLALLVGVSTPGLIRLNLCRLDPHSWPVRIAALAHEMTHVAQYQLAGGRRRTTEQWLREGMAEWVGARVLEVLGQGTAAASVKAVRGELSRAPRQQPLPALGDLVSPDSWKRLLGEGRERPMYDVSLVAAADLLDRHGLEALLAYFERFSRSDDRQAHFRDCFGEAPEDFEARLDRRWRRP